MPKAAVCTVALIAALCLTPRLVAEDSAIQRIGQPNALISSIVWVGDTAYLSGTMAPVDYPADKAKGTPAGYTTDTKAQSIAALRAIEKQLQSVGLGLGDIVSMTAYLAGDPAKGGEMDLDGWNAAFRMFFGTPAQPNKPVRATVQVARLVIPTGRIEIMCIAARPHSTR